MGKKQETGNVYIDAGLRADIMRHKMETKDTLENKGSLYVGTGEKTTINNVDIPDTKELKTTDVAASTAATPDTNHGKVLMIGADGQLGYDYIKTRNMALQNLEVAGLTVKGSVEIDGTLEANDRANFNEDITISDGKTVYTNNISSITGEAGEITVKGNIVANNSTITAQEFIGNADSATHLSGSNILGGDFRYCFPYIWTASMGHHIRFNPSHLMLLGTETAQGYLNPGKYAMEGEIFYRAVSYNCFPTSMSGSLHLKIDFTGCNIVGDHAEESLSKYFTMREESGHTYGYLTGGCLIVVPQLSSYRLTIWVKGYTFELKLPDGQNTLPITSTGSGKGDWFVRSWDVAGNSGYAGSAEIGRNVDIKNKTITLADVSTKANSLAILLSCKKIIMNMYINFSDNNYRRTTIEIPLDFITAWKDALFGQNYEIPGESTSIKTTAIVKCSLTNTTLELGVTFLNSGSSSTSVRSATADIYVE